MKATIVVPTIREDSIIQFLEKWRGVFSKHRVIVVEDNPEKTFKISGVEHYAWKEIDEDLGEDSWIIPRRTDAIRNYGFLKAAQDKPDMILTMDDDCYPWQSPTGGNDIVESHWHALEEPGVAEPYFNTMHELRSSIKPRGFPYDITEARTVINHGLWNNVPDLDGKTQLKNPNMKTNFTNKSQQVPVGNLFPMCGMNLAFRLEALPLMYFWPMGEGQPYHRFADIWMGVTAKKVCDQLGLSVRSGGPVVFHSRASNAEKNIELEEPGLPVNEQLWKTVLRPVQPSYNMESTYLTLIKKIKAELVMTDPNYGSNLLEAAKLWLQMTH